MARQGRSKITTTGRRLRECLPWIVGLVVLCWVVALADLVLDHRFMGYGIRPRTRNGLLGILFCPFLHGGFHHLILKTLPLLVLGLLVALRGIGSFMGASLLIIVLGGAGVWIFGQPANHIGASGLIFGYFGFLLARGWIVRDLGSILIAVFVLLAYGGMIWGILPLRAHVSWESHLFGLLAGIVAARMEAGPGRRRPA